MQKAVKPLKCPTCSTPMEPLLTSMYCPRCSVPSGMMVVGAEKWIRVTGGLRWQAGMMVVMDDELLVEVVGCREHEDAVLVRRVS